MRENLAELLLKYTLVRALIGAEFSRSVLTTCSCPDRAAQCSGVKPSLVLASICAEFSNNILTILFLPHFAATCNGLMLC